MAAFFGTMKTGDEDAAKGNIKASGYRTAVYRHAGTAGTSASKNRCGVRFYTYLRSGRRSVLRR